jgi:hypothetical protein
MRRVGGIVLAGLAAAGVARADEAPFDWIELPATGKTVAAELADLNGDARTDVLAIAFVGLPPRQQRLVRVYLQGPDGALPTRPTTELRLAPGTAGYDVADIDPTPGVELVLVRARGVSVISLAGAEPAQREIALPEAPSLGAVADERGLDRFGVAWHAFGARPWLLVPRYGETIAYDADGVLRGRLAVGGRANYIAPPSTAPLISESEYEVFFDAPRLSVGDVDGDHRMDVLAASRHELRVFEQDEDGNFASEPTRTLYPARISEQDYVRGSGLLRADGGDVDGDGRMDLVISHTSGGLTEAVARASVHRNRRGAWDLESADQTLPPLEGFGTSELIDVDGDGRLDLLRFRIPLSVLELVELLVTRAADVEMILHRSDGEGGFSEKPWVTRKLQIPWSFDTFRPTGFVPTLYADLNGDGHRDLLTSGGGKALEVSLGGPAKLFSTRDAEQACDTGGLVRFGDLDGDARTDLVLFDPARNDVPVRVARNRGVLAGEPPSLRPSGGPGR